MKLRFVLLALSSFILGSVFLFPQKALAQTHRCGEFSVTSLDDGNATVTVAQNHQIHVHVAGCPQIGFLDQYISLGLYNKDKPNDPALIYLSGSNNRDFFPDQSGHLYDGNWVMQNAGTYEVKLWKSMYETDYVATVVVVAATPTPTPQGTPTPTPPRLLCDDGLVALSESGTGTYRAQFPLACFSDPNIQSISVVATLTTDNSVQASCTLQEVQISTLKLLQCVPDLRLPRPGSYSVSVHLLYKDGSSKNFPFPGSRGTITYSLDTPTPVPPTKCGDIAIAPAVCYSVESKCGSTTQLGDRMLWLCGTCCPSGSARENCPSSINTQYTCCTGSGTQVAADKNYCSEYKAIISPSPSPGSGSGPGYTTPTCDPSGDKVGSGIPTAIGCIPSSLSKLMVIFFQLFFGIAGGLTFLLIIAGGMKILLSGGNPERIAEGQEIITAAIVGLLVIIFSVFLMKLIGFDILGIPGFI